MATSDQPDPSTRRLQLAELITIRDFLVGRGNGTAATGQHRVAWLHEQIAAVAVDGEVARLARLGYCDEHRQRFAALLDAAVDNAWASQRLDGEQLFVRYRNEPAFRTELHAAAGIAAYTAVRADASLPEPEYLAEAVVPTRRQATLVKAIEDHAARYAPPRNPLGASSPARYVAEAHVPGGASKTEQDWIAYYIAAHPDVLAATPLTVAELAQRDQCVVDDLLHAADTAVAQGDTRRALDLIDQAELHQPARDWNSARDYIREQAPSPAAGTAFPHTRTDPVRAVQAAHPSPPGPAPQPTRGGTHR